jgi:DNA-binding MarR family transcriptional regulator
MSNTELNEAPLVDQANARLNDGNDAAGRLALAMHHLDIEHRRIRYLFASDMGVSPAEFNLLMQLGERNELTPKVLATELNLTTGAMTAMLDRLESAGLVERRPNPTDRRSLFIHLSKKGHSERERVYARYFDAITRAVSESDRIGSKEAVAEMEKMAQIIRDVIPSAKA